MCCPTTTTANNGPIHVVIAGAGPAGLLAAINILRRNKHNLAGGDAKYRVTLVDSSADYGEFTPEDLNRHRSWMIGLSTHGLTAIKRVPDLYEKYVSEVGILLEHNTVHFGATELKSRADEFGDGYIVDRNFICASLARYLNDTFGNDKNFHRMYDTKVLFVDGENRRLLTRASGGSSAKVGTQSHEEEAYVNYDLLLGCDGIRSSAREAILKAHRDFECGVSDIFNKFKAVHIARPKCVDAGAVHVMPNGIPNMNGIALPETGDKLNVSFGHFLNNEIDDALESDDPKVVAAYIRENLRAFELDDYDDFARQWVAQDWNTTGQVHCNFYHSSKLSVLLMGDAAHATSPSIGMGMNTALADAAVLDDLMDLHNDDLEKILPAFSRERVKEGNALTYLAMHAYSMSVSQGLGMIVRGAVRQFFFKRLPGGWVMEEPLTMVSKGRKLSEAYDAMVRLGRMQAVRGVNDSIRQEYFERTTGMVTHEKRRVGWLSGSLFLFTMGAVGAGLAYAKW